MWYTKPNERWWRVQVMISLQNIQNVQNCFKGLKCYCIKECLVQLNCNTRNDNAGVMTMTQYIRN